MSFSISKYVMHMWPSSKKTIECKELYPNYDISSNNLIRYNYTIDIKLFRIVVNSILIDSKNGEKNLMYCNIYSTMTKMVILAL